MRSERRISESPMQYRILIVSEDATERSRYAQTLATRPPAANIVYEIVTVGSVAAAQLQATRRRFHLVIVALSEYDDGFELCSRLKELFPDMRLLLLCERGVTKSQLKTARTIRASVADSTIDEESLCAIVADILGARMLAQQLVSRFAPPPDAPDTIPLPPAPSPLSDTIGPHVDIIQPFIRPFLEELRRQTRAHVAVYEDSEGRILAQDGEDHELDVHTVARVLADGCSRSLEVAEHLRSTEVIQFSVHEGKAYDVYTANVRKDRFLVLFFNKAFTTPKAGLVMLLMKRSAEQLGRIH